MIYLLVNLLLSIAFFIGSIYHLKIRIECIYPIKLTNARKIILILLPLPFILIVYIAGNVWHGYLLATLATIYLLTNTISEGIHKNGIYYRGMGSRDYIIRLASWEDIKDIEFDDTKNKIEKIKLEKLNIYPDQYYSTDDFLEIKQRIESQIK